MNPRFLNDFCASAPGILVGIPGFLGYHIVPGAAATEAGRRQGREKRAALSASPFSRWPCLHPGRCRPPLPPQG